MKQNKVTNDIIKQLYKNDNAYELSLLYRKNITLNYDSTKSLTYGEIEPISFYQMLQLIIRYDQKYNPILLNQSKGKFIDLGCGSGKACLCILLSHYHNFFSLIYGIEIIPSLIENAKNILQNLYNTIDEVKENPLELKSDKNLLSSTNTNISDMDIHQRIDEIIKFNENTITMEKLANEICKQISHKSFKLFTKRFKSFSKFIEIHNDIYNCIDNVITLKDISLVNDRLLEQEIVPPIENISHEKSLVHSLVNELNIMDPNIKEIPIEFKVGDMFQEDWYEGCYIAYAASLLFSNEMMEQLALQVELMPCHSWFISLKPLPSSSVRVVLFEESFFKMSWQMAKVYIYHIV